MNKKALSERIQGRWENALRNSTEHPDPATRQASLTRAAAYAVAQGDVAELCEHAEVVLEQTRADGFDTLLGASALCRACGHEMRVTEVHRRIG